MTERVIGAFAYYLARGIVFLLAKFYWRVEFRGLENVPKNGAFILSPVHRSYVDGPLTVIFTKRRMGYLAKSNMFRVEILGKLFRSMGAISVERGTPDRQSLAQCTDVLTSGTPLVLFPEGTRQSGPVVQEIMEGAVYLATRANVPIVPVGIGGSEEAQPRGATFIKPVKIAVVVGEPIYYQPPDGATRYPRAAIKTSTEALHVKLQELFDESLVLAGRK